jgi:hypothetical protein
MSQLATKWLYLMVFLCSSRLFSEMMPSPPKKVHFRNPLRASLLFVAPWMVDRNCASETAEPRHPGYAISLSRRCADCTRSIGCSSSAAPPTTLMRLPKLIALDDRQAPWSSAPQNGRRARSGPPRRIERRVKTRKTDDLN